MKRTICNYWRNKNLGLKNGDYVTLQDNREVLMQILQLKRHSRKSNTAICAMIFAGKGVHAYPLFQEFDVPRLLKVEIVENFDKFC